VRFTFTTSVLAVDPPADAVAGAPAAAHVSARDAVEATLLTRFDRGTFPQETDRDPVDGRGLIEWSGSFNNGRHAGLGAPTMLRSAKPWVPRFLLDLAVPEEAMGANSDIRIVIPTAAEQEPARVASLR